MKKIFLNREMERTYKNNGQHAEQVFRFTLSGEIMKADNKPATECGDYLDIQIKTAKASICKGTDLKAYLELDAAKRYAYVTKDFTTAYVMSKSLWYEFCKEFGYATKESERNGGKEKIRLYDESKRMVEWLESHLT